MLLHSFLGAFANLGKDTVSFVMSLSVFVWNISAPTGQIYMKYDIWCIFRKYVEKIQVCLKSDKNNGYFT